MNAIEFKNVTKSFKDGDEIIEALKCTDFSVKKANLLPLLDHQDQVKVLF